MPKTYLIGPMTNKPFFNHAAFNVAQLRLEHLGHTVFNPAKRDIYRFGPNFISDNPTGDMIKAQRDHGFSLREALAEQLTWICKEADTVALLPGWEHSNGSLPEWATARALGLKFIYL